MPIKTVSLKKMERSLDEEKDPTKREQLRILLDEMGEVYPDEDDIPDDPKKIFTTPQQWKKEQPNKLIACIKGRSGSGKTYTGLSSSHLTPKHIQNDFQGISQNQRQKFIEFIKKYIPFTPLWVIGTEQSTYECLKSIDNEEYFEHCNINYIEIQQKGKGLSLLDHIKTYRQFLIAIYALSDQEQGTLMIDTNSGVLSSQHEIVRRVIMKVPQLKKTQGIMPRHWFWRNVEQEGIMYFGRIINMNFIITVKIIDQHLENGEDIEKIKWHEETNKHMSSIIMTNEQIDGKNQYRSKIEKCRTNSRLLNKTYSNLTLPMFMYNLFLSKQEILKERRKKENVK